MNLASDVEQSARRSPGSTAICGATEITYGDLLSEICSVAAGLQRFGAGRGDRVIYSVSNGAAAVVLFYGILHAGAVAVPVNPALSEQEFLELKDRVSPKLSISDISDRSADITLTDADDVNGLPHGGSSDCVAVDDDDPAVVFFTSGTTGRAKGVVLSHRNLATNADWVVRKSLAPRQWETCFVSGAILPLSHSFALTCSQNAAIRCGAAIAPLARFSPSTCLKHIRDCGITVTALVPSAAQSLVHAWQENGGPVPLQILMVGGAPINQDLVSQVESSFEATVVEGYGLTETAPVCAFRTPTTPRKDGSVGRAAGYADLAVLRTNHTVSTQGTGELLVRGPGVFQRYLDTDMSDFHEGWLRTGDLARIDHDGDVFIVDRLKDIIIRNGYNVSPVEVERALQTFPSIKDAGVVGIEDPDVGEEIAAFLVLDEGTAVPDGLTAEAVGLSKYKWPREFRVVSEIPRGTKGQVIRDRLRPQS